MTAPTLSVIVAPVSRGEYLATALAALEAQADAPPLEIVVPIDDSIEDVDALRARFPDVHFVDVEGTAAFGRSADAGIRHLAIDRRRAAALATATGDIVALTDEWSVPARDWCARIAEAHERWDHAVIGGAIVCGHDRALNWALFFMDAGRYQNPLPEGPAAYVTDVNVTYKRRALDSTDVWRTEYHETRLHDTLRAQGETCWLTPSLVVAVDRGAMTWRDALAERWAWSRLYAGRRAHDVAPMHRVALALGAPLIALLFLWRQFRTAFERGAHRAEFLRALPGLVAMNTIWSVGEATGYVTGRGTSQGNEASPH